MKITYKNAKYISYVLYGVALTSWLLFYFLTDILQTIASVISITSTVLAVLVLYLYSNCPYCGASFAWLTDIPTFCPVCGKKIGKDT